MKIRVTREWKRQISNTKVRTIKPGLYKVPGEVSEDDAARIVAMHAGAMINEAPKKVKKKAPENKVSAVPENKAGVAKPTKRRGRPRSKPDA